MNGLLWALVVVLTATCGWLVYQVVSLKRAVAEVPSGDDELYGLIRRIDNELGLHDAAVGDLQERVEALEPKVDGSLRHTGVVAYDAYGDVGGARSRSIAFLSDEGSGFVLSVLVSRTETSFYVKGISRGVGSEPLSPEESAAVARAQQS